MTLTTGSPSPEARLLRAGLQLPVAAPEPIGAFSNLRAHAGLLYVSGQGPVRADGTLMRGKVGATSAPRTHATTPASSRSTSSPRSASTWAASTPCSAS